VATRIENNSVSVFVRCFALANYHGSTTIVYIEFPPQHIKSIGAVWASMVNGTHEPMSLYDAGNRRLTVFGLNRRYERLDSDCPNLAGRGKSRPKFVRLVAPEASKIEKAENGFIVLDRWGIPLGAVLAAMLEHGTQFPMQLGWGDYLLAAAEREGFALPLATGSERPVKGYHLQGATPWADLIAQGIKSGAISLDGQTRGIPVSQGIPVKLPVQKATVTADIDI